MPTRPRLKHPVCAVGGFGQSPVRPCPPPRQPPASCLPPPPPFSRCFSPNVCFINLNESRELLATGAYHGSAKPVQPFPCGMVAAQAQDTLQSQRIRPVFLTRDMPHGLKPKLQGLAGLVENRSGCYRCLHIACGAAILASPGCPGFNMAAVGALETIRPSQVVQICPAGLLGRKLLGKFRQGVWIIFHGLITTSCSNETQLHTPETKNTPLSQSGR